MRYLSTLNPSWDLDARLQHTASSSQPQQQGRGASTTTAAADLTAYTTFLQTTAPPLLALSLYVSSANWAATTRPAFSALLPFPLAWTEPPALRNRMCDVAAHLGLSDLNIDAAGEGSDGATISSSNETGFLKIPERLRPRGPRGVRAALSPEQTALFRLEAAAGQGCLAVLEDLKREGEVDGRRFFFPSPPSSSFEDGDGDEEGVLLVDHHNAADRPTSLDCLAFGYLALMLVPEVPRPWLRDLIRRRYECLSLFVDEIRDEIYGGDGQGGLPWCCPTTTTSSSASSPLVQQHQQPWRLTRFTRGILTAIIPDTYLLPREKTTTTSSTTQHQPRSVAAAVARVLLDVCEAGAVGGVLVSLGMIWYRQRRQQQLLLSRWGSLVYRWQWPGMFYWVVK